MKISYSTHFNIFVKRRRADGLALPTRDGLFRLTEVEKNRKRKQFGRLGRKAELTSTR
jgi:hypothetical protein